MSLAILAAVLLIVFIPTKEHKLVISSYDTNETIDLGKYKCDDFKQEKVYNVIDTITFKVSDKNNFYNTVIKTNDSYSTKYEYDKENYFTYGYLMKNNSIYHYEVTDEGKVTLSALFSEFEYDDGTDSYYWPTYYVVGPFGNITKELIDEANEDETGGAAAFYINQELTFSEITNLYSEINSTYYNLTNDSISLKGYYYDADNNTWSMTSNYILKLVYEDNKLKLYYL